MQEILVVIAIGLAVIFIPRLMNRGSSSASQGSPRVRSISQSTGIARIFRTGLPGWKRLLIVISFFWIAGFAIYLKPWENKTIFSICITLGPVLVLWAGIWVWAGYKKYRR